MSAQSENNLQTAKRQTETLGNVQDKSNAISSIPAAKNWLLCHFNELK